MGWGSHIDGAVALIKMRGKKSLRTHIGKSLFMTVRTQMVINCMSSSRPPEMGTDWWITDAPKDEIAQNVTRLNLRTAELRAEVNNVMTTTPHNAENLEKVLAVMRKVQAIDKEHEDWAKYLPEEWKPKTVGWLDSIGNTDLTDAPIYPGKIDVYTDVWQACVWNLWRVSRLLVAGLIIRCVAWISAPVDYRTTPEYAKAARVGFEMISDIIAAIPFHLGWTYNEDMGQVVPGDLSGFACGENLSNGRALGGFFTIWPLFSANCSDFATDAQRKWITGRMRFIADSMGINQSAVLSSVCSTAPIVPFQKRCVLTSPVPIPPPVDVGQA
jgi:hypothetical protein